MRRWGAAGVIALAVAMSGCTGSDNAAESSSSPPSARESSPSSSAEPTTAGPTAASAEPEPAPVGWHVTGVTLPSGIPPAAMVGAAGRLWAIDADHPSTVYATADGLDWQTYDLTESGLPRHAAAGASAPGCQHALVANEHDGHVTFAFSQPVAHVRPDGLFSRQWMADIEGDTVTVSSHAKNGWDQMPAPSNGLRFRTWCITDMTTFNDRQVAVGGGQWFRPFETGSVDAFAATERADGRWKVISAPRKPFRDLPDGVTPSFVLPFGGRLIAVGVDRAGRYPLQVWSSNDGSSWRGKDVRFKGFTGTTKLSSALATDNAIVVVGADGEGTTAPVAWYSADGTSWERIALPGGAGEANVVVQSPDGFTAYGTSDGATVAWTSADGRAWQAGTAPEAPIAPATVVQVGDGVVAWAGDQFAVNGLDWPAAQ